MPIFPEEGAGEELPYMAKTGKCHWTVYGFWPLCPEGDI